MFGYVTANKPELKMREFYKYKAYYCGLCRVLGEKYGLLGKLTLTYDMTFLVMLLTSLYEMETKEEEHRCMVHPLSRHKMLVNEITEYAADMNIVLTYYHFLDDWNDAKSKVGYAGMRLLRRSFRKIEKKYPGKCMTIQSCIENLARYEKDNEQSIDKVARPFGELMAELFVYKKDQWELTLREMGFYLGKFIYILDAYDDIEKDDKEKNYNVFLSYNREENFDKTCEEIITSVMAECTARFEQLPCLWDVEILRNILYAGVWNQFDQKRKMREEEKKNEP